jgi:hypothetical protein
MSDGGRWRVSLEMEVSKAFQRWSVQRSAVCSIARLDSSSWSRPNILRCFRFFLWADIKPAPATARLVRTPKSDAISKDRFEKVDDTLADVFRLLFLRDVVVVREVAMSEIACVHGDFLSIVANLDVTNLWMRCGKNSANLWLTFDTHPAISESLAQQRKECVSYHGRFTI